MRGHVSCAVCEVVCLFSLMFYDSGTYGRPSSLCAFCLQCGGTCQSAKPLGNGIICCVILSLLSRREGTCILN
uniref:Secreted protein n=1 Tax=Ixodes ricinus TaxID=34613 RepID=A0A6B0U2R0_IXORI